MHRGIGGGSAFGVGVNLSPSLSHTMLYNADRGCSCTLVCEAVVGRWHKNTSREVPGVDVTVPDHKMPMRGFDAMYGGDDGQIVVIPCSARVRPLCMIVHKGGSGGGP